MKSVSQNISKLAQFIIWPAYRVQAGKDELSVINPNLFLCQSEILCGSSTLRTPRWVSWSTPSTAWPTGSTTCRKLCVLAWWDCVMPWGPSMVPSSSTSSWRPTSPEWPGKTFILTRMEIRQGGRSIRPFIHDQTNQPMHQLVKQ